jgi:hypothetical protein
VDATGAISPNGQPVALSLPTPGQIGRLTFTATGGQSVSIVMTAITPNAFSSSWLVNLYKDSTQLGSGGACCLDREAFVETVTLPGSGPGTFTIVVDPTNALTGDVSVRLYSVAHLNGPITADGTPVSGSITTPGQNAYLTFAGTEGQRVSLTASNGTIVHASAGCDVRVKLVKPDNADVPNSSTCIIASTAAFMEPVTLPVTGVYKLVVDPVASATGGLTVRLYDVPPDIAGTISVGGPGVPVTISTPGQNAVLTFSGTQGQQVTVRMTGSTVGWMTVKLMKSDNTTILTQSSWFDTAFNLSSQTLPATDTYRIVIDPSGTNTGSVTVTVTSP